MIRAYKKGVSFMLSCELIHAIMSPATASSVLLIAASLSCCLLVAESRISPRIVGGQDAPPGVFVYQASIKDNKGNHICNGVIVKPSMILTAAHCVYRIAPSSLSVLVGTVRLSQGGVTYTVKDVKVHEKYDRFNLNNDIAIVKLYGDIALSSETYPIGIGNNVVGDNVACILSSWGFQQSSGGLNDNLQYVYLNTLNLKECSRMLSAKIDESKLCTLTQSGQGGCYKDSGSPLVTEGNVVGILSGGRPCAKGFPDVYVRLSYYVDWISRHTTT